MPTSETVRSLVLVASGAGLLTVALFMAQIFLGPQLAFEVFDLIEPPNGVVALLVMSLCGAVSAAMPFGLVFALAFPAHRTRFAFLFAAVPATVLLVYSIVDGVGAGALPPEHPSWFVLPCDAILFVLLFPTFAALGRRVASRWAFTLNPNLAYLMFAVLTAVYYWSFDVYFLYIYTGPI